MSNSHVALARKSFSVFLFLGALLNATTAAAQLGPAPIYYTVVHQLTSEEGVTPRDNLVSGPDGNLYGAASDGGSSANCGTLFRLTPTGAFTKLATFDNANGCHPNGNLVIGSDGNLYGTARSGGANNSGTFFRLTLAGALTALASFPGPSRFYIFPGPLARASDGNFYCVDSGSIFKVTMAGDLSKLAELPASAASDIVQASDGNLYGIRGGYPPDAGIVGIVFKISLSGVLTDLATVPGSSHGLGTGPGVIDGGDGFLYLATNALYRLKVGDNQLQNAGVMVDYTTSLPVRTVDGHFYAEAYRGFTDDGASNAIEEATSDGSGLRVFLPGGSGGLMQAPDGYLYGATQQFIYRAHRPTKLVPKAVITLAPVAGKVIFNPQATLSDSMSNAPVRAAHVSFYANAQFLCDTYTDSVGLAKCQATVVGHLQEILTSGYRAHFDDDGTYLGSDGQGTLICIGTVCK
jgi:uncharacterized repeat protein (TIGR03803 family)